MSVFPRKYSISSPRSPKRAGSKLWGLSAVESAVAEMDKVTQNNAARADELTKTAGETDTQAQRLKEHVDELVQNCSALARKALLRMLALY